MRKKEAMLEEGGHGAGGGEKAGMSEKVKIGA